MADKWTEPGLDPDDRAYAIAREHGPFPGGVEEDITAAIRAAVTEERDACARVAEESAAERKAQAEKMQQDPGRFTRASIAYFDGRTDEACVIARAIRTRTRTDAKEGTLHRQATEGALEEIGRLRGALKAGRDLGAYLLAITTDETVRENCVNDLSIIDDALEIINPDSPEQQERARHLAKVMRLFGKLG